MSQTSAAAGNEQADVVFLVDVDNTLLDNDRVERDLQSYLRQSFGAAQEQRFRQIFEELRAELGYADFLGTLQRFRLEDVCDPNILKTTFFLLDYPFTDRLYPAVKAVVERLDQLGTAVILSDGDVVFQPYKVAESGLWEAFDGRVLIYIHKEQMLDDIARAYPARHYVLIDDKVRILAAFKAAWGDRVTTIFPRQGHYAHDAALLAKYPAPDITVEQIGDLLELDRARLTGGSVR